jgi:hypothetical protein
MSERPDPLAPPEGYGVKPGSQPEPVTSRTCTHNEGKCGRPSAVKLTLGCLGEHIAEICMCAQHYIEIMTASVQWECRGPEQRGCGNVMRVERTEWLDGIELDSLWYERAKAQYSQAAQQALDGLNPAGGDRFA